MSTQLLSTRDGISIRQILPQAKLIGADEILVRSCCGQWEDCQPDDLFVAIVDADQDGHDYSHQAVDRGATAIVTERLLTTDRPQCLVSDTREAYGKICQALAGQPCQRLTSIGVTGSDGKTVTSHLIRSVFEAAESRTGIVSSIEVNCGSNCESVPPRELNSPWLAERLSRMAMADCRHAVLEIPSTTLAKRGLSGVSLDIAVLTNIRRSHAEVHGSEANYRRANLRLLEQLKSSGVAILNADDPTIHFLIDSISKPMLTFGIKQDADVTAKLIDRANGEQTFIINAGTESVPVRTSIIGDQHIYNCLAATTAGLAGGLELSTIARGLENAGSIAGRLERVECGQPFGVWIDSATSNGQLAHAIGALSQVTTGKLICVCSTDEQQTDTLRRQMGKIVEKAAHEVVITRTTVDQLLDYEPFHQVLDGFDRPKKARLIPNRFKAIEWALQRAAPGDAVLVTGCGERPFALIGDGNWTISDRDVCQAWLYDHASLAPGASESAEKSQVFHIDDFRD